MSSAAAASSASSFNNNSERLTESFGSQDEQPSQFSQPSYRVNSGASSFAYDRPLVQSQSTFLRSYIRPVVRPIVSLFKSIQLGSTLVSVLLAILFMHVTQKTPALMTKEVKQPESEYDSGIRLDSNNAQFILFYQTKVDNEIKKLQQEIGRLKDVSKEMYSIEMKSCMEMVQGVRTELSSKSNQQEDRFTQLRSEVAAEVSALNFDMHGLLEFKNRSMHDVKTLFDVWVHDTIYSDEFRAQIEDHVRTLQAKTNQKVRGFSRLFDSLKGHVGESGEAFEASVGRLIDQKLEDYHSDRTGMTDYALSENGGTIIEGLSSPSMQQGDESLISMLGFVLRSDRNSPKRAITADNRPGNCWAFSGGQGHLVVKLANKIFVRYITVEHIPRTMSPSGQIRSAPREIAVSALSSQTDKVGYHLAKIEYDISGPSIQMFPILHDTNFMAENVMIKFNSNWGEEYTCLYRIRVHGDTE